MKIRLFVTGRAYHHATKLPAQLEVHDGATLHDAISKIRALLPDAVPLAASSLVALGGEHVGTVGRCYDRPLHEGDELTIVAPVAGG